MMAIPRHRKTSRGYGVVTIEGRDYATGRWGEPGGVAEYNRLIAEYLTTGRAPETRRGGRRGITLPELAAKYAAYAEGRYLRRGKPSSYAQKIVLLVGEAAEAFGDRPAAEFGPRALRAVRESWVAPTAGKPGGRMSRRSANEGAAIVAGMFRWAVGQELIGVDTWKALTAVEKLTARDEARESGVVPPAPEASVEAVLARLHETPRAIARLMLATAMRPSEACAIRPADLDTSGDVWVYRVHPDWNKTEWKQRKRVIYLGPEAQAILAPRIAAAKDPGEYLFRPRKRGPHWVKGTPYRAAALNWAIQRAWNALHGVKRPPKGEKLVRPSDPEYPAWHAYQLRHTALTRIWGAMGKDAAQAVGGHANIRTTLGYVEDDVATRAERDAAREAALALG